MTVHRFVLVQDQSGGRESLARWAIVAGWLVPCGILTMVAGILLWILVDHTVGLACLGGGGLAVFAATIAERVLWSISSRRAFALLDDLDNRLSRRPL